MTGRVSTLNKDWKCVIYHFVANWFHYSICRYICFVCFTRTDANFCCVISIMHKIYTNASLCRSYCSQFNDRLMQTVVSLNLLSLSRIFSSRIFLNRHEKWKVINKSAATTFVLSMDTTLCLLLVQKLSLTAAFFASTTYGQSNVIINYLKKTLCAAYEWRRINDLVLFFVSSFVIIGRMVSLFSLFSSSLCS